MLLKRVVKGVALRHGLLASFMAKPLFDEVGNGLHAHVSLLNEAGVNIFSLDDGEERLNEALGGLLATMPAATPIFAPNANSYRRFDANWFAPVVKNWGENNRRLSLRLPMSDQENRRIEHRVSGADASPHLVLAAILAGIHHGLTGKLDPGRSLGEFDLVDFKDVLPSRWKIALNTLREDTVLASYFGDQFVDLYLRVRESEEEEFNAAITQADYDQYLRIL
jgi:glutamine synthetase